MAIVPALFCEEGLSGKTKKERVQWLKGRMKRWGKGILSKFIQGKLEYKALIEALVEMCVENELVDVFMHFLNELYDKDLLPQEVILAWADAAEGEEEDSPDARCFAAAKDMIEWLREPDDDDDGDE